MLKKTIQSFSIFALIQVLVFSCCDDTFNVYYDTLEFTAEDQLDFDATTVSSEDLLLNINALYDYVLTSNFTMFKDLSNLTYATSCDEEYIFKETVTNLNIFANQDIFGITAGNSLNDKLSYRNPETNENEDLENIIEILNRQNGYGYDRLDIVLNESIVSGTSLDFTLQINIAENGRTLEATTQTITIE